MNLRARSHRQPVGRALSFEHRSQIDTKRAATLRLVDRDPRVADRVAAAPPAYLLALAGSDIVRQCALLEPLPTEGEVRVVATPAAAPDSWHLDVATRDRRGLLAGFTGVLTRAAIDVDQAVVATWPDGAALQALVVRAAGPPDVVALTDAFTASLDTPPTAVPVADARISFDQDASPLFTACRVEAPDHAGLLHAITSAIAATDTDIHAASVATRDGIAQDRFDLADRTGGKIDATRQERIRIALTGVGDPVTARSGRASPR